MWSVVALGGCAAITGLDQLQKENCADPNCDGGNTNDAPPGDVRGDQAMNDDGPPADSPQEMSNMDSPATDSPSETTSDDSSMNDASDASDAPADVTFDGPVCDSGTLGDPDNCGACGMKCDAVAGKIKTRSCNNNTSCVYTCGSGFTDCQNACGCNTPNVANAQCCGGGSVCPIQHQWDEKVVGSYFYDCFSLPTKPADYSQSLAQDACVAYAGNNQCSLYTCSTGPLDAGGMPLGDMVCSDGPNAPDCRCWGYQNAGNGMMAGFTADMGVKGPNGCECPDQTFDAWN
jgi:hypothetical protein